MAITSPGLVAAMPAMFGNIKPVLDGLRKLGFTDFSADAPEFAVKPGATLKIPVSSVSAASAYNASSNNYLTGGTTGWATLTATHYLQGFDITGANVDEGIDLNRMKQLFTARAGLGIAAAIQGNVKGALDAVTTSTGVTLSTPTLADYMGLADSVAWLNKATSMLAVNGTTFADIKAKLAGANVVSGDMDEIGRFLGFAGLALVPGMTASAAIVPMGSVGFIGRVPTLIANYRESGVQTDDETGLSVGIVIADDQATNRIVSDADLWFGTAVQGAPADASTAGVIKVA